MSNYKELYIPNHPNANSNGVISEHRYVATKMLGRALIDGEEVHHIDQNSYNNDPNNLIVFASHVDHRRFHWRFNCNFDVLEKLDNGSYKIKEEIGYIKQTKMTCEFCGKDFIADSNNHKKEHIFCSKECYYKFITKSNISEKDLYDMLV